MCLGVGDDGNQTWGLKHLTLKSAKHPEIQIYHLYVVVFETGIHSLCSHTDCRLRELLPETAHIGLELFVIEVNSVFFDFLFIGFRMPLKLCEYAHSYWLSMCLVLSLNLYMHM